MERGGLSIQNRITESAKRIHEIRNSVVTDRLRLVVEATHGSPRAETVEIRLYEQNISVRERSFQVMGT
ncbi:hypothetical protein [Paenibacillus terrae]|uniref:Uncharacterized protein n=1 Tax=Paenibacillus terrae TaxID=159743 RepID=A0A0D7X6N6_9BACL|nr:hypothetical protein [Paenibacillus terrae]KJD47046.1 hypothetical protein QD47_02485 [Paenibacillus terrae]